MDASGRSLAPPVHQQRISAQHKPSSLDGIMGCSSPGVGVVLCRCSPKHAVVQIATENHQLTRAREHNHRSLKTQPIMYTRTHSKQSNRRFGRN